MEVLQLMKRHSRKFLWLIAAVTVVMFAAAIGASAASMPEAVNMNYDGTQTAKEALTAAVEAVKTSDVNLTISSDMEFTEKLDIGTFNQISEYTLTITGNGGKLVLKMPDAYSSIVIHANTTFRNVTIVNNGYTDEAGSNDGMQQSNAFVVLNAKSVYDNVTTERADGIQTDPVAIGNDMTVNSGTFGLVAANRRLSGYNVENASVTLTGTASTHILYGTSYNGSVDSTGAVTGETTVNITGSASVTFRAYLGGWYTTQNKKSTGYINTDGSIGAIFASGSTSNGVMPETLLTIDNATLESTIAATLVNTASTENQGQILNSKIVINGGTFKDIYGGGHGNARAALLRGKTELEINGGTIKGTVYGGACLSNAGAKNSATATVTVKNAELGAFLCGGSYITSGTDEGDSTLTLGEGITFLRDSAFGIFGGSYLSSGNEITQIIPSVDKGNHTLIADIGDDNELVNTKGTKQALYGGSYVNLIANTEGDTKIIIKSGIYDALVIGGDYLVNNKTTAYVGEWGHFGGSSVIIDGGEVKSQIFGGSRVNTGKTPSNTNGAINDKLCLGSEGTITAVIINGGKIGGSTGSQNIYGGSYVDNVGKAAQVSQRGETRLEFHGGSTTLGFKKASYFSAAAYLRDNNNIQEGNSTLVFDGTGTLDFSGYNHTIAAGIIDYGKQSGNTTLEINGTVTVKLNGTSAKFTAGCVGNGNFALESSTSSAKAQLGYKHTGNVIVNANGGTISAGNLVTGGYRSNVNGNIYFNGNGTTFSWGMYMLDKSTPTSSAYCSISGDLNVNITGGSYTQIVGGGVTTNNDYAGAKGVNIINGDVNYTISGGTFKGYIALTAAGAKGNITLKFIGDKFSFASGLEYIYTANCSGGYQTPVNAGTVKTLDLSQVTLDAQTFASYFNSESHNMGTAGRTFGVVYPPLNLATAVSIEGTPKSEYKQGETFSLEGTSISYESEGAVRVYDATSKEYQTVTSAELSGDRLTSTDGITYYTASDKELTNGRIGYATTGVKVVINGMESEVYPVTVTNAPLTVGYVGSSIRLADPRGLRVKASIDSSILADTEGYTVTRVGILVSKSKANALVRGGQYVADGCVYGEGIEGFILNEEKDGKYIFALAITGIEAIDFDTELAFRPYVEYTDEYGETGVVYSAFEDAAGIENSNLVRTIQTVAQQVFADTDFMATLPAEQKKYIEDIINSIA